MSSRVFVAAFTAAMSVAGGALAADLPPTRPPAVAPPIQDPIVSGVYAEFFGGWIWPSVAPATDRDCASPLALIPCGTYASITPRDGWRIGGALGYRFNPLLRADVSLSYSAFAGRGLDIPAVTSDGHADFTALTGLVNGYVDLAGLVGPLGPFSPYVGAGVGFSSNRIANVGISLLAAPNVTATFPGGSTSRFAWSLTAGTGVSLAFLGMPRNLTLDVRYRYIDHGGGVTEPGLQQVFVNGVPAFALLRTGVQTHVRTHALELGLRWTFGGLGAAPVVARY